MLPKMQRTKKLAVTLIIVVSLVLLFIYGNHDWPITFDWDDKAGFKTAYLDLPFIHPPVVRKALDYILVPQSRHFIASYFRKIKWKAARGTAEVWTLGGILIVVGLSNVEWHIVDPYKTELMYAAEKGELESVKHLIETGAKVDERDQNGRTPLIYTTRGIECKMPVLRALISAGANLDSRDKTDKTALIWAAGGGSGCVESLEILIAAGADVNTKTDLGETPLMAAVLGVADETTAMDIVKTLIAAGADINARDSKGDTALSIAMRIGRSDIAKLLTESSAKK